MHINICHSFGLGLIFLILKAIFYEIYNLVVLLLYFIILCNLLRGVGPD